MKTHFITGGTGYLGRELVRKLLKKGDRIFILVRNYDKKPKKDKVDGIFGENNRLFVISGDITKKNLGISHSSIKKLGESKIDLVWHLAANLSFSSKVSYAQKYKDNVMGTKNVVDFTNKLGSRLCHCSTIHVGGNAETFKESELNVGQEFRNDIEETKFLAEIVVRKKSRVPYVILRPSIIVGKPNMEKADCTYSIYRYLFLFYMLRKWLLKGYKYLGIKNVRKFYLPIMLPYPVGIKVNIVHINYLVRSFINIAYSESAFNTTYHLTHPNPSTYLFLSKNIFKELSFSGIKFIGISPKNFRRLVDFIHFIAVPWRSNIDSAKNYLPYMSYNQIYVRKNINKYNTEPKKWTKKYFGQITKEAYKDLYPKVKF